MRDFSFALPAFAFRVAGLILGVAGKAIFVLGNHVSRRWRWWFRLHNCGRLHQRGVRLRNRFRWRSRMNHGSRWLSHFRFSCLRSIRVRGRSLRRPLAADRNRRSCLHLQHYLPLVAHIHRSQLRVYRLPLRQVLLEAAIPVEKICVAKVNQNLRRVVRNQCLYIFGIREIYLAQPL